MQQPSVSPSRKLTLPVILIAAAIQGCALYGLHHAIKGAHWPATDPAWLTALYSVAIFIPVTVELLTEYANRPIKWVCVSVMGLALFYFGWHHGSAIAEPLTEHTTPSDYFALAPVLLVLWLLVLPFVQSRLAAGRWSTEYRALFTNAWRNKITLLEATVFTGVFWMLLGLWQVLFHMLQIDFFRDLFQQPVFIYPVTALVFGCALHLIGSIERLISAVLQQILDVLKWLATVAGVMLALFTLALFLKLPGLVFFGHKAIGAAWLLWLIAVMVLLLNSAYRDGSVEQPYPKWIGLSLRAIVPLTLFISVIAIYALIVRTQRYGLTVERVWAFVVAGAAAMYSAGYSVAAFRKGAWLAGIARVNVVVALALIAIIAAALTPALSPYRLAANSQYHLILDGRVDLSHHEVAGDTAFHYLRFDAGHYGRQQLEHLRQLQDHPNAEQIRMLATVALQQQTPWVTTPAPLSSNELVGKLTVYPPGRALDADLISKIANDCHRGENLYSCTQRDGHVIAGVFIDLNADGRDEFVLLTEAGGFAYENRAAGWEYIGHVAPTSPAPSSQTFGADFTKGNLTTAYPQWKQLSVGSHAFRVVAPE